MVKVWVIVIVILNGGHAYELDRPYQTEELCVDAKQKIAVGMAASVNCVPAYEEQRNG